MVKGLIAEHLTTKYPFLEKKKLLLAVSGGIDSMVMLHVLKNLKYNVSAAHCNFKLRGEDSEEDQLLVKEIAQEYGIPYFTKNFETKKLSVTKKQSIQSTARELRYSWFADLLETHHFDYLLTAHHLNDSIESFLFYTFRGTGLRGLTGIPEINDKIIRPLSDVTKETIEDYAIQYHVMWREDRSNLEQKYQRNKIRHSILPELKKLNPNYQNNFLKTKTYIKHSISILDQHINHLKHRLLNQKEQGVYEINISDLNSLNPLEAYLFEIFRDFGFENSSELKRLLQGESGKFLESETHTLTKNRSILTLTPLSNKTHQEPIFLFDKLPERITQPIYLNFSEVTEIGETKPSYAYFDKSKLKFPFFIKKIFNENGYFYPFGLHGKKSIKKFLRDEKLSLLEKEGIWGLFFGNNLAWIIGHRVDQRFSVDKHTKNIIRVVLYEHNN